MKKLPIGISDYKKLIEGDYYYVDKTFLIKELITIGGEVTLIPRPRRFGKTLNLSMLKYFFECTQESNDHLFSHMNIWKDECYQDYQGRYPVIFLTFKDVKVSNGEDAYKHIINVISDEFHRHAPAVLEKLSSYQRVQYEAILAKSADNVAFERSLLFLTEVLYTCYKERVIVLLDEYDVPLHAAYMHGYYTNMLEFMRSLLTGVLKDNRYLERSVLTGILALAKSGIFTGLNNLNVFALTSVHLADKFGFTNEEIAKLFRDFALNGLYENIRAWYNGYTFGQVTTLYNPWSVLKCAQNQGALELYWVNTSDNVLLKRLIARADKTTKAELEDLLHGNPLVKEIEETITFSEIEQVPHALWSLLLFTGYLTYTHYELIKGKKVCSLIIPNEEVFHLYASLIKTIFVEAMIGNQAEDLLKALIQGNTVVFQELLQGFVLNSMSMYDLLASEPEKSYHLFVLGLLVMLSGAYKVKSNRESGFGRYDIMIIPRDTHKRGIIIEFKKVYEPDNLESAAQKALDQIHQKHYAQELRGQGIIDSIAYGIAFHGKRVLVKSEIL